MMTDRDLQVGIKAATDAATKLGLALPHDQAKALAAAVIVHVGAARSPVEAAKIYNSKHKGRPVTGKHSARGR